MTYNEIMELFKGTDGVEDVQISNGGRGGVTTVRVLMTNGAHYDFPCYNNTAYHVYVKYAAAEPASNADMKDEPDTWVGIAITETAGEPTEYTAYTWIGANDFTTATEAEVEEICV